MQTPSGGLHFHFRSNGREVRNSAGKLGPGLDVRGDGGYVLLPGSRLEAGPYRWAIQTLEEAPLPEALFAKLSSRTPDCFDTSGDGDQIPAGKRNATLTSMAGAMRRRGMSDLAIAAGLLAENASRCRPALPEAEVRAIAASIGRYPPAQAIGADAQQWPNPLGDVAFHGPIGELVQAWAPENEADTAAMLVTMLVGFGSVCDAKVYHAVNNDRHPARLFVITVGESSKARKGMSSGPPLAALQRIDPEWFEHCIREGLSTGEGLIHQVRNPLWGADKHGKPVCLDGGVADKRLFVKEGELARMFAAMVREGNTLSQVIRAMWDTGDAGSMTKQPYSTTGAHVSILGHITAEELRRS